MNSHYLSRRTVFVAAVLGGHLLLNGKAILDVGVRTLPLITGALILTTFVFMMIRRRAGFYVGVMALLLSLFPFLLSLAVGLGLAYLVSLPPSWAVVVVSPSLLPAGLTGLALLAHLTTGAYYVRQLSWRHENWTIRPVAIQPPSMARRSEPT